MRYEFADHEFTRVSFSRVGRHGRVTSIKTEIDLLVGSAARLSSSWRCPIRRHAGRTVGLGASGNVVLYFLSSDPYKIALRSLAGGRPAGCLTRSADNIGRRGKRQ